MKCLVTGGAGYIGSICAEELLESGHEVTVLDNLSTGYRAAVPDRAEFVVLDVRDTRTLGGLLEEGFECVLHFAASSIVSESMRSPVLYFENNVGGCISLLRAMSDAGVDRLVFSSSAAVYGVPEDVPIAESVPLCPTNPYGRTKLMMEEMMETTARAQSLRYVSLRYFNAAGASGARGECHRPETHLIPLVLETAAGARKQVTIYGDDYPTPDGTCVRDYIHVLDLARAHVLALEALERGVTGPFNLGNGQGFSVREVVETARAVTGCEIPAVVGARRPGDPPSLVAASARAEEVLAWRRASPGLEAMIESAWSWMQGNPGGYEG